MPAFNFGQTLNPALWEPSIKHCGFLHPELAFASLPLWQVERIPAEQELQVCRYLPHQTLLLQRIEILFIQEKQTKKPQNKQQKKWLSIVKSYRLGKDSRVAKAGRGSKVLMRSEICTLISSIVFPTTWFSIQVSSVGFKQVRQIFMCLAGKGQFAEWCFIESMFCCILWKSNHSQL